METEKLYYKDPYQKEFDAVVTGISGNDVMLDKTCFYPEGGGQAGDTGVLNGEKVVNTLKRGGRVVHVLENPPEFREGDSIHGKIDWERRYKLMKIHTAAHIVYYKFVEQFGRQKLIGSNMSENRGRIDYEYQERLDPEKLKIVEDETNEIIRNGLEITLEDDPTEAGKRWWRAGEWNMPCGGTHVRDASEIGAIRIKRENIGGGKERVEIKLAENGPVV